MHLSIAMIPTATTILIVIIITTTITTTTVIVTIIIKEYHLCSEDWQKWISCPKPSLYIY